MLTLNIHEPPRDLETEQAVLGCVLARNDNMDRLGRLSAEHFSEPLHAVLFDAMRQMWAERRGINLATLRGIAAEMPDIADDVTPTDYIRRLIGLGDTSNLHSLAETLIDYANRRLMCEAAGTLYQRARTLTVGTTDAAAGAVQSLDEILSAARSGAGTRKSFFDAASEFMDAMLNDDGADRITTGFASLDKRTGGWRRRQLAVVAARPSMGKSMFTVSSMVRTAKAGTGVLFFSLEMSRKEIMARALSDLCYGSNSKVVYKDALQGGASDADIDLLGRAAGQFGNLPLVIDDQTGLTIAEIAARIRAEAKRMERAGGRLGLVMIDHLGKVKPSGRYAGNKVQETGEISEGLKHIAMELDVAVVALHQLNRGTETQDNKRPALANLRNSGDVEQDADMVAFIYREAYYLERNKGDPGSHQELQRQADLDACRNTMELIIGKNRNGPTDAITLFCDLACNAVRDLASEAPAKDRIEPVRGKAFAQGPDV